MTTGCFRLRRTVFAVALSLLLTTGCPSAMSSPSDPSVEHHASSSMFPLRFKVHDFEAYCFNTLACSIVYNDYNFTRLDANKPSGAPPSSDYRDHWGPASHLGIRNFPPPAEVHWTSLDGSTHRATVDIGEIFKDERVLYRVPDTEIPDRSWNGEPGIFLEVNDRTINVYMQAFIATKTEQIPGNKYSYGRDDVIRAWTHTY